VKVACLTVRVRTVLGVARSIGQSYWGLQISSLQRTKTNLSQMLPDPLFKVILTHIIFCISFTDWNRWPKSSYFIGNPGHRRIRESEDISTTRWV